MNSDYNPMLFAQLLADAANDADRTLIVGLGKTGLSCARFLARQGIRFTVTDTRITPPGLDTLRAELPSVPVAMGGFSPAVFAAAERLIVSPGVPVAEPLIQQAHARGAAVLGDIELFAQALLQSPAVQHTQVIAVTGSNGKSTVVSLLGAMAQAAGWQAAVGGNLGEPALDLLHPNKQLYVLELSSFQLETTYSLAPTAAAILNISPDHMDRYATLSAYFQAKARIYNGAKVCIVNRDDPLVNAMTGLPGYGYGFTLHTPQENDYGVTKHFGELWLCHGSDTLLPVAALRLQGRHNVANALAALAIGTAVDLPKDAMLTALQQYDGLPHRTQLVRVKDGVRWYNDSKGTNPGATVAALEGLATPQNTSKAILIAGGEGKGADFTALATVAARTCRSVILFGRDANIMTNALHGHVQTVNAVDLADAVHRAANLAQPGDHVLLSPACASFDMFRNYEHRGEVFADLVRRLDS